MVTSSTGPNFGSNSPSLSGFHLEIFLGREVMTVSILEYSTKRILTSLIISKTKVGPIKRLSILRFELCGALILTWLLCHTMKVLKIPIRSVFAWTDSTVVLGWLFGNAREFKMFVGNRVSSIIDRLPLEYWKHFPGPENPADCASRGLFPSQLKQYKLW